MSGNKTAVLAAAVSLLILLSITTPMLAAQGTDSSDGDKYPSKCESADVLKPGFHTGSLSPDDNDAFLIDIKKGDYVIANFTYGSELIVTYRHFELPKYRSSLARLNGEVIDPEYGDDSNIDHVSKSAFALLSNGSHIPLRVYSETSNPACLVFSSDDRFGEWTFSFVAPEGVEVGSGNGTSDQPTAPSSLQTNVERINELEMVLEQKNQTINELRGQLQNQSTFSPSISINVTVTPDGNQESFRVGGTAVVEAQTNNAAVRDLSVRYAGDSYSLDDTGTASIPLEQIGTQQMLFSYQNTTERIELDVQQQETTTGTTTTVTSTDRTTTVAAVGMTTTEGSTPTDTGTAVNQQTRQEQTATSTNGPGFTALGAVLVVLMATFLIRRHI